MLDLAGILFSSTMMLMVIIRAVRLDQRQPWFQSIKRNQETSGSISQRGRRRP